MKFTLFDIEDLIKSLNAASTANDCLLTFLADYDFEDIYKTEDNTLIFNAGGKNLIEIEFLNFENPLTRKISIMYWENGQPVILNHQDLIKIA